MLPEFLFAALRDRQETGREEDMRPRGAGFGPAFVVEEPVAVVSPAVFASPHSGRVYPEAFLALCRARPMDLRRVEDAYVDRLLSDAPVSGAPLICGLLGRSFVDLNRAETEIDPSMFEDAAYAPSAVRTPRVDAGLGCLPRVAHNGQPIYGSKLPSGEAEARLEHVHRPYHRALGALLKRSQAMFGRSWLVDCHSMPSDALTTGRPADVVLGDRHGASCNAEFTSMVEGLFQERGYNTARNVPYAGGYATMVHGRPAQGRHALQIEIRRDLYLDEGRVEPHEGFDVLRRHLSEIAGEICTFARRTSGLPAL